MTLDAILETGFHRSIEGLELLEMNQGQVRARLTVSEALLNFFGKLHGGAIATLVDDLGTFAVVTADRYRRAGVTTDLQISYLAPASPGDLIAIDADILRCALNLAFVEVTLRHERRGHLIARGRMTKLLTKDSVVEFDS